MNTQNVVWLTEIMSNKIKILNNFSGNSIGDHTWKGDTLTYTLSQEPIVDVDYEMHDYNLHFIFGLRNMSSQILSINININTAKTIPVPEIIYSSQTSNSITQAISSAVTKVKGGYTFKVVLQPKSDSYFSNTIWNSLEYLSQQFTNIAHRHNLTIINYGTSYNGHPLRAYQLFQSRKSNLPLIYFSSGSHPAEGDTIACQAIMEHLVNSDCYLTNKADVVIIPILNPDGFQEGNNGCNSNGINFFWDFQKDNEILCPEAHFLWELFKKNPPNLYIDFHAYSIQGSNKIFGPYIKPTILHSGSNTKHLANKLANALETIPNSKSQLMLSPSSLPFKLTREFNTITFAKYHLHQNMGVNGMKKNSILVARKILDTISYGDLTSQILKPYGKFSRPILDSVTQFLFMQRYYLPKKIKYLIRTILS